MPAHQHHHRARLVLISLLITGAGSLLGCQMREQGLEGASTGPAPATAPKGGSGGAPAAKPDATVPPGGPDAGTGTGMTGGKSGSAADAAPAPGGTDVQPGPTPQPPTADAGATAEANPPAPSPCTSLTQGLLFGRAIEDLPRSDEITFDNEGRLLAFSQNDLIRFARGMPVQIVARNLIGQNGGALRVLADGDIVVADFSRDRLIRIDAQTGLERNPMPVQSPMKVVRGPGNTVFVTSNQGIIYRIDPQKVGLPGNNQGPGNAESRNVVAQTRFALGGLSFSADYRKLYVGDIDRDDIYAFPVDAQGTLGREVLFASQIPNPQALATDACGNVYAVGNQDGKVRRISIDGKVAVIADLPARDIWALSFGSGKHGFAADALYALDRNGGSLYEIRVGVRETPIVP